MDEIEFVIALTEHRFLGSVFQPFLIERKEQFYSVVKYVKPHDFNNSEYQFKPYEIELVNLIEKFSDERLMRKFSRAKSVSEFYSTLKTEYLQKQISPFIEKCMMQVVEILMLSPVRLFKKDAHYANLYEEDKIEVSPFYGRPEYHFERTETVTRYRLKIFLENKEINLRGKSCKIVTNNPCLMLYRSQLVAFEKLNSKKLALFFEKEFVEVSNAIEEKYYAGFIKNTVRDYEVKAKGFEVDDAPATKSATLSLEKNLQYEPVFVLHFKYGDNSFPQVSDWTTSVSLTKNSGTFRFRKTVRNPQWEEEVVETLGKLGLNEKNGSFRIESTEPPEKKNALYFLINWLNDNQQQLKKHEITVVQEKLEKSYFTGPQSLEVETFAKGDWFDMKAVVRFGTFSIPFLKLKKYILNNIREFKLPNGEIAILPEEWFTQYKGLLPFGKQKGEHMQFGKHHFMLLQNTVQQENKSIPGRLKELVNTKIEEVKVPDNLKANLRKYQEEGFNWMHSLNANSFGGCLADDMGLGKTLQALTLLLKLKRPKQEIKTENPFIVSNQLNLFNSGNPARKEKQQASLIVVPTSLVHNWQNEIKKFTPSLKVFKYVGVQRKKIVDIEKISELYDVIITTYGTVRNDCKILAKTEFFYLILDESQYIKNSTSKTYKAIMELRGKHRLVITGTPIENSLSDLWSQMNFLNPGIFGTLAFFKRTFILPIEKHADQKQQERLQLMIKPFILRRKKRDVASDLPPLVEQVVYCPLEEEQQKLYEKEKSVIRNAILTSIEGEGVAKSAIVVLQGLTKLRQLACHPTMVDSNYELSSGKFDEIFRMLHNLVAENHKVLIFSSFVKHLNLLQNRIEAEEWKYSLLTGQTTKREKVINEFQTDAENRIFLISLKAGGVGLNLTKADYVFIIDPWWNPATENQAINRAHRIGQNKHVFVYRFITEDSIEEKIQKLKERKSSLADRFINSNNPFKEITRDEIVALFE